MLIEIADGCAISAVPIAAKPNGELPRRCIRSTAARWLGGSAFVAWASRCHCDCACCEFSITTARTVLIWINAFTRYVYLPAYVCLDLGAVEAAMVAWRSSHLAVVGCHVVWMLPDFVRDRRFDPPPSAVAPRRTNRQPCGFSSPMCWAIESRLSPLWKEIAEPIRTSSCWPNPADSAINRFGESPLMAAYVHANGSDDDRSTEKSMCFSKLPIKSETQNWVAGRVVQTVDIEVGSQTLAIDRSARAAADARRPRMTTYGYWKQMVPLLTAEKGPLVIVGDFNATEHSLVYKQLKAGGLRSAHDDRGRGYATTWPNGDGRCRRSASIRRSCRPRWSAWAFRKGGAMDRTTSRLFVDVRIREAATAGRASCRDSRRRDRSVAWSPNGRVGEAS